MMENARNIRDIPELHNIQGVGQLNVPILWMDLRLLVPDGIQFLRRI